MATAAHVLGLALLLSILGVPGRVLAQQPSDAPKIKLAQPMARPSPATTSKAVLAARFQDIKSQYAAVKATVTNFSPVKSADSAELKLTRSKLSSAMYSYELYEAFTQKQRDQLNLLVEMSELDSLRLQMAMDRLSKMIDAISNLVKKMSKTGDAMI